MCLSQGQMSSKFMKYFTFSAKNTFNLQIEIGIKINNIGKLILISDDGMTSDPGCYLNIDLFCYSFAHLHVDNLNPLGQVKKQTCLASGFLKKRKEEGLFILYFLFSRWPPFFLKFQISIVFSTVQTHNT